MTSTDSQTPNLGQAFAVVMHWLDFNAPLGVVDTISLQSAFEDAAKNTDIIFVASNQKNVVVMHDAKIFSMQVPQSSKNWYRELAEEKDGLIIDRPDLFLGNFKPDEDPVLASMDRTVINVMYDATPHERKFRFE